MQHLKLEEIIHSTIKELGKKPRILVTGKTGCGKSSLVNALLRKPVAQTSNGKPCTQSAQEEDWTFGAEGLVIIDVPGFAEAGRHEDRVRFMFEHLPDADVALLVVGAPDRAWEHEQTFIADIHTADPSFPVFVVGNRIDMFNPVREWNPSTLNLKSPSTPKEKAIVTWGKALKNVCGVDESHFALVCAGESFNSPDQYGLDLLAERVVNSLPEAVQNRAARAMNVEIDKKALAEKIIWGASVAAAGVALTPIPFADAALLAPIQAGMILKIADIYGKMLTPETAASLLASAFASFGGRTLFVSLVKCVPGLGTLAGAAIGAAIAGPITLSIGYAYLELFARDNFHPSREEVETLIRSKYEEAQSRSDELVREAATCRDEKKENSPAR